MHLPQENTKEGEGGVYEPTANRFAVRRSAPMNDQDFSDYMWMGDVDLEEFDRQVINEIDETMGLEPEKTLNDEEEEFLQQMLEEEERDTVYFNNHLWQNPFQQQNVIRELNDKMLQMNVTGVGTSVTVQSNLNPDAAEFIPRVDFSQQEQACNSPINVQPPQSIPVSPIPEALYTQPGMIMPHEAIHPNMISVAQHLPLDLQQNILMARQNSNPRPQHIQINQHRQQVRIHPINPGPQEENPSQRVFEQQCFSEQMNGNTSGNFYPNPPVYVSTIPVYQAMVNGGSHLVQSHRVPYAGVENGFNEEERFGDSC